MTPITVSTPSVGLRAYFTFKEPFQTYIQNTLGVTEEFISLDVISVADMEEMVQLNAVDPYHAVYSSAGVTVYDYEQDYLNKVPIVTLKYTPAGSAHKFVRVPLNYIVSHDSVLNVTYVNKAIIIDLGIVDANLDTSVVFTEIIDLINGQLGLQSEVKEVSTGEPSMLTNSEHEMRQTVINNRKTVFKSKATRLIEVEHAYDQVLLRLQALNITLG